ncbi:MAG: endonuclease III [Clostridia bacterium]|nr:endonuclease III [Clostridia bacterium]
MKYFSRKKSERANQIHNKLKELYPDAKCALDFKGDPFRLLVMSRLSAQCTDKRVNEVSVPLFQKYPDASAFANASISELEEAVRPCGLFRTKAFQIKEMSKILVEKFQGEVPQDKETLLSLPGVGEKIANLMLGDVFGDPHIVADTHCIRLAGRFSLTSSENPSIVTKDLEKIVPKEEQADFCHRIILLGREFCKAQNPKCENCPFQAKI